MIAIAIDIGGTFTDVVCLHDQQHLWLAKVPTTPHHPRYGRHELRCGAGQRRQTAVIA
jgi:N-methylhydantoinase A/oxoprolinase/acetone carboxylase beta subunit